MALSILFLVFAHPSFSLSIEWDLAVKESIESHFQEYDRQVDLSRLEYDSDPKVSGQVFTAHTSVWAERGFSDHWGWHRCTTEIQILLNGDLKDLGSDCHFDFD